MAPGWPQQTSSTCLPERDGICWENLLDAPALTFGLEDWWQQVLWGVPGRGRINGKQRLEVQGRFLDLGSGTSVPVLNGGAWVRVCVAGVFACVCLLTQWDAAQAELHVPAGCALCGQRFCLSLLLRPSPSRCCIPVQSLMTSSEPQNDRTGDKTGSNLKSVWPQAREHCGLLVARRGNKGNVVVE